MLVVLLACARHAPDTSERFCDPDALAHDLQVAIGPQACTAEAQCSSEPLAELLPGRDERVPDMREWDPATRPGIVRGPETSTRELEQSLAKLLEDCPRTWNGRSFSTAVTTLPYSTPGGNDLCSTSSNVPACLEGECRWRRIEHLVDCGP